MRFKLSEKRAHYNAVAKGEKPVKANSKFSKQSQMDYARGAANMLNESAAIYKYHNSSVEERAAYAAKRAESREYYKAKVKGLENN